MNKAVLITNVQKIKTNLEQTIENLSSMLEKEKIYSKEQIQKNIDLLHVKLQNDDNYKIISNRYNDLNLLIPKLEDEKSSLKRAINGVEFRNKLLNKNIEDYQSSLSFEQKELEILANSLNISDNDEEIYALIKEKRDIIGNIKSSLDLEKNKIIKNDAKISGYKETISELDSEQQDYCDELDLIDEYEIDENKKAEDFKLLNKFNGVISVIDVISNMTEVVVSLNDLIEYLQTREADLNKVEEKIPAIKQKFAFLNGVVIEYLALVNLDDCADEQGRIKNRLNDEEGYFLSDLERKRLREEIFSLNLDIALCEAQCLSDEQTLNDYENMVKKIDGDIAKDNAKNFILQGKINDLTITKFMSDVKKCDEIDREIRKKQREINNSKKHIEKLMKNKIYYEFTSTDIKRKKRNSESLLEDKKRILNEKKELEFNNLTSKYSLEEDKTNLLYLDLIVELYAIATDIIEYNYLKKLDDVAVESLDSFESIIACYPFNNPSVLYNDDFIESLKESMNKLIYKTNVNPNKYIEHLNLQGVNVIRHGEALQSMDSKKEVSKTKVLNGDFNGK